MKGAIRFVSVLMCDDIRHELDGGVSLMGIGTPVMEVSEFPYRRRVSFALVMDTIKTGAAAFTTSLIWRDVKRWSVEHEIEIEACENGAVFVVNGTLAGFDQPGRLTFEIEHDGKTIELQSWDVRALATTPPPNQPKAEAITQAKPKKSGKSGSPQAKD